MALTIPVAHDFNCPQCWIALHQVRRLQKEFGVQIDWRGYELYPAHADWPDSPAKEHPADKPKLPSRFQLQIWADGLEYPKADRPPKMRTYHAHQAVEYAKTEGTHEELIEAIYRAYWEQGKHINDPATLREIAGGIVHNLDAMMQAVESKQFLDRIVHFNDDAFARGVYNLPTFFIAGQKLAEQPYHVLRKAVQDHIQELGGIEAYGYIEFPPAPQNRPHVFLNMIATIDGKILSGNRDESVHDLGTKVDKILMKRIEAHADAVMLGAQTLRATPDAWNPRTRKRIVVTNSGEVPHDHCFIQGGDSFVATSGSANIQVPEGTRLLRSGNQVVDFPILLHRLRSLGIQRLLVMGGSEINAQLFSAGLVDELFLTIAPKIKLGKDIPTIADGHPLSRADLQKFKIVEHHVIGNEVFLRYRRSR